MYPSYVDAGKGDPSGSSGDNDSSGQKGGRKKSWEKSTASITRNFKTMVSLDGGVRAVFLLC